MSLICSQHSRKIEPNQDVLLDFCFPIKERYDLWRARTKKAGFICQAGCEGRT
uniref:Uncharacterized protein n=1 Tax=Anguilla anguilla TaxID=7936 RepID=A0A0E9SHK4_ANGAN